MAAEVVLYTNPMSRGRIVRWMLEEVGCPYRAELLDYGPAMKSAAYLAVNPMGKVPAIRHGGAVVTEAAAICAYLADAFPAAGLAPPQGGRGPFYRWLFFAAGPLEAATAGRFMGWQAPPDREGMLGYGTFAAVMNTLEQGLERALTGAAGSPARPSRPPTSMSAPTRLGPATGFHRQAPRLRRLLVQARRARGIPARHRHRRRPRKRARRKRRSA